MNITANEYWLEVNNIANSLLTDNKADYEDKEELEEAINDTLLHETIDGHQWIIYYSYNLCVYQHSQYQDYYINNLGVECMAESLKQGGLQGLHQGLAYWCLYADVQEALCSVLEDLEY